MVYHFNWSLAFSYLPMFFNGLLLALGIAVGSLLVGTVIGLVAAGLSLLRVGLIQWVVRAYVEILRNVPILLWAYFAFYGLPYLGIVLPGKVSSFVVALSLYAGAYLTEVFRAGLVAIPTGYSEAAKAIGLSLGQRIRFVLLPLMFRIVLPSLSNTFISLFKDTSIAAALAVPEVTYAAEYVNTNTFRVIEAWTIATVIYLGVSYGLAVVLRGFERRFAMVR